MVITNGKNVGVGPYFLTTCCQRCRPRRSGPQSRKHIPDEMWFEILSRLPIQSLFTSRCVCKLWKSIFYTLENKIDTDPLNVPLCGLFLSSVRSEEDYSFSYLCLETKKRFMLQYDSPQASLNYSSGFERGLLSNLSFDFSMIHKFNLGAPESRFHPFFVNGGLLLVTLLDGSAQVHNPATKQIHFVPKSRIVAKHGFNYHAKEERPCLILGSPSYLTRKKCRFTVVRFCIFRRTMELYYSVSRVWRKFRLELDDDLLSSVRWRLDNYLSFFESGFLSLYVLTNKDRGIAIKFKRCENSETVAYSFPLPEVVHKGYSIARIWQCEKSLFLSYYNSTSLWIWKAGCTKVDAWTWVPMLEISQTRQLCNTVARCKHLSKVVLDASVGVMPLACNPYVAVVYVLIKSSLFTYNLNTDTLERIADMKDDDVMSLSAYTFRPCLSFMDAGEESSRSNGCESNGNNLEAAMLM